MLNNVRGYLPQRSNRRPESRRTPTATTTTTTTTSSKPKRRSLISYSPIAGTFLLVTSLASGTLLSIFFSLYPPRRTAVIILSLCLLFAYSGALFATLFHPSIRPPPQSPGKTIFVYYFAWIGIQASGFVTIDSLWARSWPDHRKNYAVAWMLLSITTVALWTYVLITIMGRTCREKKEMANPEAGRISTRAKQPSRPTPASQDDAVHVEHIEFSEPPTAYFVIRVREKDEPKP